MPPPVLPAWRGRPALPGGRPHSWRTRRRARRFGLLAALAAAAVFTCVAVARSRRPTSPASASLASLLQRDGLKPVAGRRLGKAKAIEPPPFLHAARVFVDTTADAHSSADASVHPLVNWACWAVGRLGVPVGAVTLVGGDGGNGGAAAAGRALAGALYGRANLGAGRLALAAVPPGPAAWKAVKAAVAPGAAGFIYTPSTSAWLQDARAAVADRCGCDVCWVSGGDGVALAAARATPGARQAVESLTQCWGGQGPLLTPACLRHAPGGVCEVDRAGSADAGWPALVQTVAEYERAGPGVTGLWPVVVVRGGGSGGDVGGGGGGGGGGGVAAAASDGGAPTAVVGAAAASGRAGSGLDAAAATTFTTSGTGGAGPAATTADKDSTTGRAASLASATADPLPPPPSTTAFPPSLLAVDADGQCVLAARRPADGPPGGAAAGPPPTRRSDHPPFRLKIRVLTMARPAALARLLAGLVATDFRRTPVSLQIAVDTPRPAGSNPKFDSMFGSPAAAAAAHAARAAGHAAVLSYLHHNLTWPHGPLTLDVAPAPRGLVESWVHGWPDPPDDEALLVLEDDLTVAPGWWDWLEPWLAACFGDAAAGVGPAAHLAGISLSAQNKIVGEAAAGAYDVADPADVLATGWRAQQRARAAAGRVDAAAAAAAAVLGDATFEALTGGGRRGDLAPGAAPASADGSGGAHGVSTPPTPTPTTLPPAYLSQQVSSWAPVLFPRPWRAFVAWYDDPARRPATPCLPALISNQWWRWDGSAIWTVWWHRWAYEAGAVFLYPTGAGGGPQATNHMEPGEHFITQPVGAAGEGGVGGGRSGGGGATPPSPPPLPPLTDLPLYDLHMRAVSPPASLLYRSAALEGVDRERLCWWVGEGSG